MTAREELFEAITGGGWSRAPGDAESANRLIDAFAHELAERQRAAYSGDGPDEDNWIRTPYDAADLIDPEAQR